MRSVEADRSVARLWNEAVLAAIRSDFPAPTIHARNLFHSSAAMWDAWAAYDPDAVGRVRRRRADRRRRRGGAGGGDELRRVPHPRRPIPAVAASRDRRDPTRRADGRALLRPRRSPTTEGDSPAAFGNRIAEEVLAFGATDGSNEAGGYVAEYTAVNPPLVVDRPGTEMTDPNRWQPLELEVMEAQNGIPLEDTVQTFVGPNWGDVTSFALPEPDADGLTIDPGPPPLLGDPATDDDFKTAVNEVIRYSATLDPASGDTIDLSPAVQGNRELGTYETVGHERKPGHRRAVLTERGRPRGLRPGGRRVLGRRADVGDASRPLELDRQPRHRRPGWSRDRCASVATGRRSIGSNTTSSSTSRSTAPCTMQRSRPGVRRATTTTCVRSR